MNTQTKKLVSYIPSGSKDTSFTTELIESICEHGTDIVELGLPFSDPLADGSIIQEINLKALNDGFKIKTALEIGDYLQKKDIDFLYMGYFNTFYQKGFEKFLQNSKGCIVPDMPFEETLKYIDIFDKFDKDIIGFIAPTTNIQRIKNIVQRNSLFIYLVAYTGVTGSTNSSSTKNDKELLEIIKEVKKHTKTPIYLGFGVSADNAKEKVKNVDGVVVGSSYVKVLLDNSLSSSEKIKKISSISREIKDRIN